MLLTLIQKSVVVVPLVDLNGSWRVCGVLFFVDIKLFLLTPLCNFSWSPHRFICTIRLRVLSWYRDGGRVKGTNQTSVPPEEYPVSYDLLGSLVLLITSLNFGNDVFSELQEYPGLNSNLTTVNKHSDVMAVHYRMYHVRGRGTGFDGMVPRQNFDPGDDLT